MRSRWVLAMATVAVLLPGCGGGGGTETAAKGEPVPREVGVALDGYEGPENLGILMAEEREYFWNAGLYVLATKPAAPYLAIKYVSSGVVDLGVSHQPQVVLARERGVPIVAVGSLISQPTAAMIWLGKSKIGGVADLKGRTIAIPGLPFQRSLLQSVLARAGLTLADVTVKDVGDELVPALVKGEADAIFGGSGNLEGAVLESRGLEPVVTPVTDLGVPPYDELTVVARADFLSGHRQLVRDFMAAVASGTAAAVEDPEAAVKLIEGSQEANLDLSRRAIEAEVEATLPLLSEDGYMDLDQASELIDWMHEEGMIERKAPVSELLTNDYLASTP